MILMQVIAQAWAGVMPRAWAADHGCWPGQTYTNANMTPYYDPIVSPLDDYPAGTDGRVECGSGPYTLDLFDYKNEWRLEWFPNYWRGWPYEHNNKYGYQGQCGYAEGWIKTVTFKGIDEWATRKSMFLAGDCDFCYVPRADLPEMVTNWNQNPSWDEEVYPSGITCIPRLPSLSESNLFFNFNITVQGNEQIGDPPYDQLHETGIPYWFFNDTHVRKAFAYSFNYTDYIEDLWLGEAVQPSGPMLQGLAYWEYCWDVDESDVGPPDTVKDPPYSQPKLPNGSGPLPPVPKYYFNLTEAEYHFKLAYGGSGANPGHNPNLVTPGQLWTNGFTFDLLYWTGGSADDIAFRLVEEAVNSLNPKFHTKMLEVDWPTYLGNMIDQKIPLFYRGELAEYPDPHSLFYPYMNSTGTHHPYHGTWAGFQNYSNATADKLIKTGITNIDDNKRIETYWKLANIYFQDCVSIPLVQYTGRHWERDWMEGYYYTPGQGYYFHHYWKGYSADVNFDYQVDLSDLTIIGAAWDSKPGDTDWAACADVDNDGWVYLYDLTMAGTYYG
jgi:peptide/nickel transport system substrate-binding protein